MVIPTAGARPSARWPTTCSCATTAPSGWWTGPTAAGLVKRVRDPEDHRVVRLQLTAAGSKRLEALSEAHLEELGRLGRTLPSAWRGLLPRQPLHGIESRA